jgi:uncharacterized protein YjbI with pentapeptide repeats
MITALAAIGALIFTGLSLNATRDQVAIAQFQNAITEQGQFTDRYTKAVEQLDKAGADHLQARIGAIYSLERLTHDSPRDQPTIIEVISAFIRTNTPAPTSAPTNAYSSVSCPNEPIRPDIQAALVVLGRRNPDHDQRTSIALRQTCLAYALFDQTNLSGADLTGANLTNARILNGIDLTNANLYGANLAGVTYADTLGPKPNKAKRSKYDGASFSHANLPGFGVFSGSLVKTDFSSANLDGATIGFSDLRGAYFNGANLRGAKLDYSDLRGAHFRSTILVGADLQNTEHDQTTEVDDARTDSSTLGKWW